MLLPYGLPSIQITKRLPMMLLLACLMVYLIYSVASNYFQRIGLSSVIKWWECESGRVKIHVTHGD